MADELKTLSMAEGLAASRQTTGTALVDVREAGEFTEGHIPGAINFTNEDIGTIPPSKLPDMNQTIYVYCRSGRRSKDASAKLVAMGYTHIIECGGISDWTGDIEK